MKECFDDRYGFGGKLDTLDCDLYLIRNPFLKGVGWWSRDNDYAMIDMWDTIDQLILKMLKNE